jgi:hypothetical protein
MAGENDLNNRFQNGKFLWVYLLAKGASVASLLVFA